MSKNKEWNINDSNELYRISRWGENYFSVNDQGHLCVTPESNFNGPQINIMDVVKELKNENVTFPVVLRFQDVLHSQVKKLNTIFNQTIKDAKFNGEYFGVFPIKVNQMREVVEEIIDAGAPYNHGLEAGSKAELLAALAMNTNEESLTILNGYKDEEFMRLALIGREMGRKVIVVIEKFSELEMLIKLSKETGIEPMIGIRAKLNTRGSGKWAESGGDFAKFGLTIPEIMQTLTLLRHENMLDSLKLFHFHVGSQIPDIRTIKESITEASRIFTKLIYAGAKIEYFDVGGGVGINYDGSKSNSPSSVNYSLEDYVGDVVYILKETCDIEKVPHPHIVSESGRALTAHHSCVVFDVFGAVDVYNNKYPTHKIGDEHILVKNMRELSERLNQDNFQDIYNDACLFKDEGIYAFKLGILSLDERAKIETLYWHICHTIVELTENIEHVPTEIQNLKSVMAKQYLCNLSVFQSAADSWAIGQVLPVVPLHRLNERPTITCTLADITCDSDGKIDNFIGDGGCDKNIKLHKLNQGEEYLIGLFLTGAYQDTMGDMHNLFGRVNEAHIFIDDDDPTDFYIEEIIRGNKKSHVLKSMQYSAETMINTVKNKINKQIKDGKIKPRNGVKLIDYYEKSLYGYTYLEHSKSNRL